MVGMPGTLGTGRLALYRLTFGAFLSLFSLGCESGEAVVSAPVAPAAQVSPSEVPGRPFHEGQTWIGQYDCAQGTTELRLRIRAVRGNAVDSIFEFRHVPSGAFGQFTLSGTINGAGGHVVLEPGEWLERPRNYVMVGMDGTLSPSGDTFTGRITEEGCGGFSLRREG